MPTTNSAWFIAVRLRYSASVQPSKYAASFSKLNGLSFGDITAKVGGSRVVISTYCLTSEHFISMGFECAEERKMMSSPGGRCSASRWMI